MIDHPDKQFQVEDFPAITNNYSVNDIKQIVLDLYKISKILRSKRIGALTLNQPKLQYQMKADSKTPLSFSIYQQKESNRLVEEYMLLANMHVARKLCLTERIFDKVILRRHPPPNSTALQNTIKILKSVGIEVEGNSSNEIAKAIRKIENESTQKLLIHLLAKSMQLAVYCCASCVPDNNYSHYALNVDFYTHFTSPIRRYPDILVHRLLGAMLGKLISQKKFRRVF
jgi:DIS3-like exonuclease 2